MSLENMHVNNSATWTDSREGVVYTVGTVLKRKSVAGEFL